jgi:hypothetical protein
MKLSVRTVAIAIICPILGLPHYLPAQSNPISPPAPNASAAATDETDTLRTFEVSVSREDSYESLNTSGVTGTNRSLRSLPMTMNAYTRTFIDEIGATDVSDLLKFTPNVSFSLDSTGGGTQSPEQFRLRGLTSKEERRRNGFALPLKLRPSILAEMLLHPAWILEYLRAGGLPTMGVWQRYAPAGATPAEVGAFFRTQSPSIQTWRELAHLRSLWPGIFVIKGIQHPDDALRAVECGFDGIIVSNHGGKVFDALPSPLETLPAVRAAVPRTIPVMMDSGVRRGTDILIARALGADFVFVGRATLYGVVAGGEAGADRAVALLADEVHRALAMIGCPRAADLDGGFLFSERTARPDPAASTQPRAGS